MCLNKKHFKHFTFLITFLLSVFSDNENPIFLANNLIERLKWAEPVKYNNAKGNSSKFTLIRSKRRCRLFIFGN
jgi:hypothetical protein